MQPTLSLANESDARAIATVHAASWRSAYRGILRDEFLDTNLEANRLELWTKRLSPKPREHFGYIATVHSEPVGFSYVFGAYDNQWGTQIDNLHVIPQFKSKGLGRMLLAAVAQQAAEQFADAGLYLWVYEQNRSARKFYERLGARCLERAELVAPGGGLVAECRYAWQSPVQLMEILSAQQFAQKDHT